MSAVRGLLWEQWRQTRVPVLFGFGATCCLAVLIAVAEESGLRSVHVLVSGACWFVATVTVCMLFVYESRRGIRLDFPQWLLVLPMRTRALVLTHFLYRLFVATALGGVLTLILFYLFNEEYSVTVPIAFVGILAAFLHVTTTWYTAFGLTGAGLAGFAGVSSIMAVSAVTVMNDVFRPAAIAVPLVCAALAMSAYAVGVLRGEIGRIDWWDASGVRRIGPRRAASPAGERLKQMVWLEWHQVFRYLTWISIAIGGLCVLGSLTFRYSGDFSEFAYMVSLFSFWSGGHFALQSPPNGRGPMAAMPCNEFTMAWAKQAAGLKAIAISSLAALLVLMILGEPWWYLVPLCAGSLWVVCFIGRALLVIAGGSLLLMRLLFSPILYFEFNVPEGIALILFSAAGAGLLVLITAIYLRVVEEARTSVLHYVLPPVGIVAFTALGILINVGGATEAYAMLLALLMLGLSCYSAMRRRLLPRNVQLGIAGTGMITACACATILIFDLDSDLLGSDPLLLAQQTACVYALLCLPLSWNPVMLHWQRHR
ncbi:MAG: hypothetical protein HYV27_17505 [Candidatus Hydrogenedentes bacterium]|nr:hypothetical protein [Candidatus Hydrogenedentota bacterium]